jgi:hypothetical protein
MNWRRGLFRLWVLAALGWFAVDGWQNWEQWTGLIWPKPIVPDAATYCVEMEQAQFEAQHKVPPKAEDLDWAAIEKCSSEQEALEKEAVRFPPYSGYVTEQAVRLFGPPLVLLLAGLVSIWGFIWVRVGFRQSNL